MSQKFTDDGEFFKSDDYFKRQEKENVFIKANGMEPFPRLMGDIWVHHDFQSGAKYTGNWHDNEVSFGLMEWPDGATYEGQYKAGVAEGLGVFTYPDGCTYTGEWLAGKRHGLGAYSQPNEKDGIYRGDWRLGERVGKGVELKGKNVSTRHTYCGVFKENVKAGFGVYEWPDGGIYEGTWVENVPEGRGMYTGHDKRVYKGSWKSSGKDGYGMMVFPSGEVYKGQYEDDKYEGFGQFLRPDGKKYDGFWREGQQQGYGQIAHTQTDAIVRTISQDGKMMKSVHGN